MPMQELSNLQIELLKMYSNGISEKNLHEIKLMLAKYFADKASDAKDIMWEERSLTAQDMVDWTNEHNRAQNSR